MSDAWMRAVVRELRPGAEYAGKLYDQDVVVEVGGKPLCLFDMTPMIGAALKPGQSLLLVVALSAPMELRRQSGATCTLAATSWQPERTEGSIRPELHSRQWALLDWPAGPLLIARSEIALAGLATGDPVTWENGRLDLLAWKPG